ncbi:hypothetical protein D3C85_1594840 [compost metagenome]
MAEVVRALARIVCRQESDGIGNVDEPVSLAQDHVVVPRQNVGFSGGVFLGLDNNGHTDVLEVVLDHGCDVGELCTFNNRDDFQGLVRRVSGSGKKLLRFFNVLFW